jgi:L-iditol 2-dehydrogenase
MKTAILVAKRKIGISEAEKPQPRSNEALIETKAVGICGTDLSIYKGEHPQAKFPMVMGHEAAGIIVEVGSTVSSLSPGEKVVVDPGLFCGKCWFCRRGSYYQCENLRTIGVDAHKGAFAEYFTAPAVNCHRLSEAMSWEEAALVDTLACPLHSMDLFPCRWGEIVAVLGPGPAGLCFVQLTKLRGARKVILSGTHRDRLSLGEKLGADLTINITKEQNVVERVREKAYGRGVDLSIIACGRGEALKDAISMTRRQGRVMIYGLFTQPVDMIDLEAVVIRELTLYGSAGASWAYDAAINLISSKRVMVTSMITHRFKLEELDNAFNIVEERKEGYIKGVVIV